ncbi:uncharacterized protein JCM10292_002904 [Rhodotorula paludigena]|uniref:uncharacterized protein n=1 Tax=Rhodotorula paludigena TaxID=86838 RepID=UPI00316FE985
MPAMPWEIEQREDATPLAPLTNAALPLLAVKEEEQDADSPNQVPGPIDGAPEQVKEEDEDVEGLSQDSGSGRRRSARASTVLSYAEEIVLDDEDDEDFASVGATDEDDDEAENTDSEASPRRVKREQSGPLQVQRQHSIVKAEDDEEEKEAQFALHEAARDRPRPASLQQPGFNIYREHSWDSEPIFNVTGAEVQRTRTHTPAHRGDLGGETQKTFSALARRPQYGTARACFVAKRNIGCRQPGQAFVQTAAVEDITNEPDYAVFMQKAKPSKAQPNTWEPWGIYRIVWNGTALPHEYEELSEAEQTTIINVFMDYLTDPDPDTYNEFLFYHTVASVDSADPDLRVDLWETRHELSTPQQRYAIDWCLRNNVGLNVGYNISIARKKANAAKKLQQGQPAVAGNKRAGKAAPKEKGKGKKPRKL